ncbi:relaxase/mobilization nuclease domain-containing protein [Streptomyces noursei]|uniref:relaxase/mobilization nuclease domain-containing protein n=1 Tax=Streptomyces noursei TaxID=1971 RepID=UPI0023B7FC36|nr:mobilization protein [Streptomyces noursei]
MIPKKAQDGDDTWGLLYYLYGPGTHDEHLDPHMVAAWAPYVDDPAQSSSTTLSDLAMLLDAPVLALSSRRPDQHVYHVPVRNSVEDRVLTDAEWAVVAREIMHAAGVAEHGDDQGCRWVAIRHAEDHIHIVATKARQDGRRLDLRQDIVKMHRAARQLEVRLGLRRLVHGDRTAHRWPTRGELEKASRRGLSEPVRDTLQRTVREAAASATGEADFFARLTNAGLRVQQRLASDGKVGGYCVALPGDRNRHQRPVWFGGSQLARDLSLPRVRERWTSMRRAAAAAAAPSWSAAAQLVCQAAEHLGANGQRQGAGDVAALGDLVVRYAAAAPELVREQLQRAAAEYERAGRAPGARDLEGQARHLCREANEMLAAGTGGMERNATASTLAFLVALVTAIAAARRWHQAQECHVQARAAERAGHLLAEAVEVVSGSSAARRAPSRTPRSRGAGSSSAGRARVMAAVVQKALPERAREVLADAAWPALRTRLATVEQRGHDPVAVLSAVARQRELRSAESIAEVLAWRLDGWARTAGRPLVGGTAAARKSRPAAVPNLRTRRPPRAPGSEQPKGPGRVR